MTLRETRGGATLPCPCCGSTQVEPFFRVPAVPVFSVVTVTSRERALEVPRRDLELAFCHGCGFIYNHLFDRSIDYFTLGYEDQQGFSRTFRAFIERVADDLIERHALRGRTLMEIGCGKGDFLDLLCTRAQAHGIGIDPAYVPGRLHNERLTFHREFYAARHGALAPDFIACRHTLEHIADARGFMQLLRDSIPAGRRPALFFEVPDVDRILDLPAFWDIYSEHCSYFSAGSLAQLFRRTGFEITALRRDYDDQYLLIEAVAGAAGAGEAQPIEEAVAAQLVRVRRFQTRIADQLGGWRERLAVWRAQGKKVSIWGGGSKSVGFLTHFAGDGVSDCVVDINPHMENNHIPGIGSRYVQPQHLAMYRPDVVIIMNGVYRNEIATQLSAMGLAPELHAL